MSSVTIQNVTKAFGPTVVLENFDAVFENLPIVDSMTALDEDKKCCGMNAEKTTD